MPVVPPSNLGPNSTTWGRWVTDKLVGLTSDTGRNTDDQSNQNKQTNASIRKLASQVRVLQAQAQLQYAEWSGTVTMSAVGYYNTPTAVISVNTPTGKLEVGIGGSLNNGNGYFLYSIVGTLSGTLVDRATVLSNYAQRVALSGGASFSPSGFNTIVVSGLPMNEDLTVNLELYAASANTTFIGGRVYARAAP